MKSFASKWSDDIELAFSTALILAILQQFFKDQKDLLLLIQRKATSFVERETARLNVDVAAYAQKYLVKYPFEVPK